jgi:hypothetical protein
MWLLALGEMQAVEKMNTCWAEGVGSFQVAGNGMGGAIPWIREGEFVTIDFDLLEGVADIQAAGWETISYRIVHCDEDWQRSSLMETEYMQGFQDLALRDMESARGTALSYTHYRLRVPNDDVQLKVSGNYAVQFFRASGERMATGCFCVSENKLSFTAEVSGNTLTDTYGGSQQLDFSIDTKGLGQRVLDRDLRIRAYQNGRLDNAVKVDKPFAIAGSRLDYSHLPELIFEAGNEFRRCEFLTSRERGMRVDRMDFFNGFAHVTLTEDKGRSVYRFDRDINGRFVVNCIPCQFPETEGDYFFVHFTLRTARLPEGEMYLSGEFRPYTFEECDRMQYDEEEGGYVQSLLLKQGQYNYHYLFLPNGSSRASTAAIEGNFHQTENEYSIYVYFRPLGEKYDRLAGVYIRK